jgi:hypothetical protein
MKNKNVTFSEQNEQEKQKIKYCKNRMKNKNNTMLAKQNKKQKYYIVGTKLKTKNITLSEQNEKQNTTLSEQSEKQKILHCRNKVKNKKIPHCRTK